MTRERKSRSRDGFGGGRKKPGQDMIFGLHAAAAVLNNRQREVHAVMATENAARKLAPALERRRIAAKIVPVEQISRRLGGDSVHQGILVETSTLPATDLSDILDAYGAMTNCGPIIALDQVTDPHNAGAVLRSAAAFGAAALVMTARHSPPLDGVLAKAASGALEHVPVARVTNLARALSQIGDAGLARIGLDSEAGQSFEKAPLASPCALVLGAENKGLRRLTRENCDYLCRIATHGAIASLNISNAAAVALHACLVARNAESPSR